MPQSLQPGSFWGDALLGAGGEFPPGTFDFAAGLAKGFDATPREARNAQERFWRDVFYVSGGGLSFPTSLAGAFGTFRGPISKLLRDASGRGANSEAARAALLSAQSAKGPSARQALVAAAREYANRYTVGLGTKPLRTLTGEQLLATSAGIGYALPETLTGFTDDDGRIMMDLGEGEVDVMPSIKILSSLGLPVALAHTPTGIALMGDKTKVTALLKWVTDKGRVFGGSLIGGFSEKGQHDLASRIFNEMAADQGFLQNVFLPAVESGHFKTPGSPPPTRVLTDGTVVLEYGGLRPDTLQALKQLGLDDPRLAAMDATLRSRGRNDYARLGEETRRAERLDETFDLLKTRIEAGDEAVTYKTMERVRNNLDAEALDAVDDALVKAREVYEVLEPAIGRDEASRLAVEMLDGARLASRDVRKVLWDKELIGTEFVDTRSFGDWAISVIKETSRNLRVTPGMSIFYKLAGKKRIREAGLAGEAGKPITLDDLGGVKGDTADVLLRPEEIPENGLYDIFGESGTLYAQPVKIDTLDKFRSEVGDLARAAHRKGDAKLGHRYGRILDYIDNELLAAKNFEDADLGSENIRNIKIGREYTRDAKERFGPNSEIGRILYRGDKPIPEEFLQRLLKRGPGAEARVELFRNALNEPQQDVQDGNVTWRRDPAATLGLGDNPNVIEAELLRRFTEGAPGPVTQRQVDRFVTQYKGAIKSIPGLLDKFNNLKAVQSAVDEMTTKLTVPDREKVFAAIKAGATTEDVATARRLLSENLVDRQLANTASEYLGVDVNQAAINFIDAKPKLAVERADQIAALLAKDESGAAEAGFRAALWRALRDSSRRFDNDRSPMPGVDTKKLIDAIERSRPYLEKFYDKSSMEFLDELVKGGPLQRTGTGSKFTGTTADVMSANFATVEALAAFGRTAGQKVFGTIGINPLVATGMGRRIAAYTFGKIGEEKILKIVEDALRDPEKAAALIRLYKDLPDWKPSPTTKQLAEQAHDDPMALATKGYGEAKDTLARGAGFVSRYLSNHSLEAIERAARFGLIPAQAEIRRESLEEDYEGGPPFTYEDNRIRYEIENRPAPSIGPQTSVQPSGPANRRTMASYVPPRAPVQGSVLSRVSPVGQQPMPVGPRPTGPVSQETLAGLSQVGLPLFANYGGHITAGAGSGVGRNEESGIMSVRCKPRQIVG